MRNWINLFEMSAMDARQLFTRLGVDMTSQTPQTLKAEYRKLMMQHHPDRGGDVKIAQDLSAAYNALKDNPEVGADFDSGVRASWKDNPAPRGRRSDSYSMDHPNFEDIDYVKWYFEQKSEGEVSQEWTIMAFDSHFFRGSFTVKGRFDLFTKMAAVMRKWDRFYDVRAVFAGTRQMLSQGRMSLIWSDGEDIRPMITIEFDSMNSNPANDQQLGRKLPAILDAVKDGSFVSQHMVESAVNNRLYSDKILGPEYKHGDALPKYGYRNISNTAELDAIMRDGAMKPRDGKTDKYFTMSDIEEPTMGNRGAKPVIRVASQNIPNGQAVAAKDVELWNNDTSSWDNLIDVWGKS